MGQFFTNRKIINCFVDLCDELGYLVLDKKGNIPTICDPNCGSGGFLVSLVDRLNKKFPNINWKKQQKRIEGYDIAPQCIRSTKLNLLCMTGVIFDKIVQRNTMTTNLDQISYDIFCGNPPYGGDRNSGNSRTQYNDIP